MSLHALVAQPTRCALGQRPLGSLNGRAGFATAGTKATWKVLLLTSETSHGLQRASSERLRHSSWQIPTPAANLTHRPFSSGLRLQRRWMERHQPSHKLGQGPVYTSQSPPEVYGPRSSEPSQWSSNYFRKPPSTHNVTYGLIGLFVAVWCAHNYAEGGSVLPNGIPLPKPPGWDGLMKFFGLAKERNKPSSPGRGIPSRPMSPTQDTLKTYFSSAALSYRTSDYPPAPTFRGLYPFCSSIFSHFEPLHLALNSYWTYATVPPLVHFIGVPKVLAVFAIGGILASGIQCATDRAYALNQAPWLFKHIKAAQRDPDPNGTMGAQHMGSSGALFAVGTVRALLTRERAWRWFALFAVTLDSVGYYMDLDTGVSYSAHLGGVVAGGLMWFGWLRWTKGARFWAFGRP